MRFGGDHTSTIALRTLAAVRRELRRRGVRPRARREVQAAVAELAEVTGWLLCDADRHALSIRVNRWALDLARRAGDRSMELFVVHNLSLQATYLRHPERSLALVRPVLDRGGLTPRLTAMFTLRIARAYAQMGLRTEAVRALDTTRGRLSEGVGVRDPHWAWWVSERGLAHATGAMLGGLGEWGSAIDPIQRALEAAPESAYRDRFLYLCVLMHAYVEAGARHDAERVADDLLPLLGTVGSSRPLARLRETLDRFSRDHGQPRGVRDTVGEIRQAVNSARRSVIEPATRKPPGAGPW
ncbi:hypothetical protein DP939_42115 [Spongiactinospora rosea]|uniref:Uncharacterized protein n=1 Tax=Spongiactinospora rosea TaxID=2248750 RepID=A0A366LJU3_9ACTN|nr:hypothetical protein DP939_42115 [Spongiactinospora rosea]